MHKEVCNKKEPAVAGSFDFLDSLADGKHNAIVFSVDGSVRSNGKRRICRANRYLQEELRSCGVDVENTRMPLRDPVDVSVLAVDVDKAVRVNRRSVNAPFKTIGMVAGEIDVMELPLRHQRGTELRNVERSRGYAGRGANSQAH